jgi:hypothetical protein
MMRVLSLGAGVQSTTLALMAAHGEIGPMPDCAIFADTQDEGAETYAHLEWLCGVLPFPVYRPTRGRLSEAMLGGDDEARIPAFVEGSGLAKRQCTRNFKIRPIRREVRRLLGAGPRSYIAPGSVEQWIGISIDEADRMKPAGVAFMVNRWPLIEARLDRAACARWAVGSVSPTCSEVVMRLLCVSIARAVALSPGEFAGRFWVCLRRRYRAKLAASSRAFRPSARQRRAFAKLAASWRAMKTRQAA